MSFGLIIIPVAFIIYNIINQNNSIININNTILEQRAEIILINRLLSTIQLLPINYNIIQLTRHYIYSCCIIILIDIILIVNLIVVIIPHQLFYSNIYLSIVIILLLSLVVLVMLNYIGYKYILQTEEYINNKEIEIKLKKEAINNVYIKYLLKIVNDNDNIEFINNSIDEYISNHLYLNSSIRICYIRRIDRLLTFKKKDKQTVINEIENKLLEIKKDELNNVMNTNLKNINMITPEIVKLELAKLNEILDDYKNKLQIKINMIKELSQINSIIININ
jgi:hypothetical protein